MSKAFRNQVATIAALEGFCDMMIDVIKQDEFGNKQRYPWNTPIKETLLKIKQESRYAQLHCKGQLTKKDFIRIYDIISGVSQYFKVPGDTVYSIVSFISFSLIGLDDVINSLNSTKTKLINKPKILSFERLAAAGFELVKYFDPELDSIQDYERAKFARKQWNEIFNL
jgi:hypothetical protein